jgi:hypothetical protein
VRTAGRGAYAIRALPDLCRRSLLRPALFLADHLVLQRKRADCGIASPVIAALCGQNANRQSEHERGGGDDYAFGHHGSPLSFYVHVASIAVYSTAACDGRHRFGEYTVEHAEHVSIVIAKNYSRRASLARWGWCSETPAQAVTPRGFIDSRRQLFANVIAR